MQNSKQRHFTTALFTVYFLALVWIILFKFTFQLSELVGTRNLNLTLYVGSAITGEMVLNVLAFIPFGIYMSMLKQEWSFIKRVAPIFITSLLLETLQYVLMIGASDITDLVGNTLGGCIGIGIFCLAHRLMKDKTLKVLTITAFIATVLMLAWIAYMRIVHM